MARKKRQAAKTATILNPHAKKKETPGVSPGRRSLYDKKNPPLFSGGLDSH